MFEDLDNAKDNQKRQVLEADLTIKQLQDRLKKVESENKLFADQSNKIEDTHSAEIGKLTDIIERLRKKEEYLLTEKAALKNQLEEKTKTVEKFEEVKKAQIEKMKGEWESEKQEMIEKYKNLEFKYGNLADFEKERANLEAERKQLQEMLDFERKEKMKELADKDREKVQVTDKLKKDMLHKIQETRTSLLALKREQLDTTTRLTVLQNHQLTTELEYQSKQTEKLLFKNSKLQEQVTTLKRDVEIHKQVEAELAKRSHFCQKLIKKLSAKIKELEEENDKLKNPNQNHDNTELSAKNRRDLNDDKNKDDLITFLEKNLESAEKRLAKLHNDYDILKNDYNFIETKLEAANRKYGNLASILKDNLDMILRGKVDEFSQNRYAKTVDLNELKDKDIGELAPDQKETLLLIILDQAKQFITRENLDNRLKNVDIIDGAYAMNKSIEDINLPRIGEKMGIDELKVEKNKFHDVPLEISTKIVRSNLRDWGKPTSTMPMSKKLGNKKF